MRVVYADPGKALGLNGAPGPLQTMAVTGTMTWQIEEDGGLTMLTLTYVVTG